MNDSPSFLSTARRRLRRWFPLILALALCGGYYAFTVHQQAERAALTAAVSAGQLNADGAAVAAAANASVPPFGLITGKLIYALALFLVGIAATWFVLRFVVPVVPRWATGHGINPGGRSGQPGFAEGFAQKSETEKVDTTLRVIWALWGLWAVCALAACLVS